jgi:AcrR family transcriptional regulator
MASATAERPRAAERIQCAAKELFYRQGIRATGVEEVCRVADATKMSLYRAFPSKDALVAAILDEDAACREAWFARVTEPAPDPVGKLRALVAGLGERLQEPECRGCAMLLAQAEFPDPSHPTHQLVADFKRRARGTIAELARQAGARDAELLADTLAMLIDGAWSALPYLGGARAAEVLRHGAETALREALG